MNINLFCGVVQIERQAFASNRRIIKRQRNQDKPVSHQGDEI
jgi:hypothetical protein